MQIISLIALFIIYFILAIPNYSGDVKNHVVWGKSILNEGTLGFYNREFKDFSFPNYPPISMLSFAASEKVFRRVSFLIPSMQSENIEIAFLKLPAILPFIGAGVVAFFISGSAVAPILIFLNPALFYLSIIWGQNDLLQIFFLLLAFYFLIREKKFLAFISASFAILSKQTILLLWLFFLITAFKKWGIKTFTFGILLSLVTFYLLYLPFHSPDFFWPFQFYIESLKTTGFLTQSNAINFWGGIFNFATTDAASFFGPLTLEKWGFILFGISILPIIYYFWKQKLTNEKIFLTAFIISINYFFFLTRMHERYLFPAPVLASILIFFGRKYWINLIFFTFVYFINLYRGLYIPDISFLNPLIKSIPFLTSLVIVYFCLIIYNLFTFIKYE